MDRVGVRALRQDASALLRRVERGEMIEITNHGKVVGLLVPATSGMRTQADLVAAGDLRPGRGRPLDVEAVQRPPGSPTSDELLRDLRDER